MNNELTLAVAGGRKTQSIVDNCISAQPGRRILVLTYTQKNRNELISRLAARRPLAVTVEVQGWFSFLIGHCVRPYLPKTFPGRRLRGFIFDDDKPDMYAKGEARFLDSEDRVYKRHLARLADMTNTSSRGAVIDRLSRMYDTIYVDEVQDLNGYDLEILSLLMNSSIELRMVGDIRQAIINTNVREPKNSQYKGVNIKKWFDIQASKGRLTIVNSSTTWRCNPEIAALADSVFDASWGFDATKSENHDDFHHRGIYAIDAADADAYLDQHNPLCLRLKSSSWSDTNLPFTNIGMAKGATVDHVLIAPTDKMLKFLRSNNALAESTACSFYVAVTRARHSVAFLAKKPEQLGFTVWRPQH